MSPNPLCTPLIILGLTTCLNAQQDWVWQNPLPQGHSLYDIHAFSGEHAVAVGAFGTIIETRDGGETWIFQETPTTKIITSVFFLNPMVGWAVTSDGGYLRRLGEIIHTSDGGVTWYLQHSSSKGLRGVQFVNEMTGWVVGDGGSILRSDDGGQTWRESERITNTALYSLHFLDAYTGWCAGEDGVIIKTEDGGTSWSFQNCGRFEPLRSLFFVDPMHGWAGGDGAILLNTRDGGATWTRQASWRYGSLSSIHMSSRKIGYAVGKGLLLQTIDGANWLPHAKGAGVYWFAVDLSADGAVWIVGENRVLRTISEGHTWTELSSALTRQPLNDVQFVSPQIGWAVGDSGTVLKTVNGGEQWQRQPTPSHEELSAVQFLNESTGWTVGDSGTILKTTDGGQSWISQSIPHYYFQSVFFVNADTGWVGGRAIYKTTDGGESWKKQTGDRTIGVRSLHLLDRNRGWAAMGYGGMLRTGDGGATWIVDENVPEGNWESVFFVDEEYGWASGKGIIATVDGGESWQTEVELPGSRFSHVFFTDRENGWAYDRWRDRLLKTPDGGQTWLELQHSPRGDVRSLFFVDRATGWIVGDGGSILKTTTGGGPAVGSTQINDLGSVSAWADKAAPQSGPVSRSDAQYLHLEMDEHRHLDSDGMDVFEAFEQEIEVDSDWIWQNPRPTANDLTNLHVLDPNTAIAVGQFGTIVRTNDGGETWTAQNSTSRRKLLDVHFVNANTGWAVGYGRTILNTRDGGQSWRNQTGNTVQAPDAGYFAAETSRLEAVFFADEQTGWAVGRGGLILATSDGGEIWMSRDSHTLSDLRDVWFLDAQRGWAVGCFGMILNTVDGGETWRFQTCAKERDLNRIFFVDDSIGWSAGDDGYLLRTTNGGITWNHLPQTFEGDPTDFLSLHFVDGLTGWAVAIHRDYSRHYYLILMTTDGGVTWVENEIGRSSLRHRAIEFADRNTGWLVGDRGSILKTEAGGGSWTQQRQGPTKTLNDIFFVTPDSGWVVGGGYGQGGVLLSTVDGGDTWSRQEIDTTWHLRAVTFLDSRTGWIVGDGGAAFNTSDGGATWGKVEVATTAGLEDVLFSPAGTGWIVGDDETLLRSTDGGVSWEPQPVPAGAYLNSIFFLDERTGWISGTVILKTADGGATWQQQSFRCISHCRYHKIWFLDEKHGYAAGTANPEDQFYASILETLDGGETWLTRWDFQPERRIEGLDSYHNWLLDLSFSDNQVGWIVGNDGVFKTTNGGARWINQRVALGLNGLFFIDENTGWAVGENGTIVKTNNAGGDFQVEPPRTPFPEPQPELRLFHNFPNPFNPETTIRFEIPEAARTTITIFDMLGRKVVELLDAELAPGEHQILWRPSKLATGVYFCRLTANSFTQTRKLVLLR